MAFTEIQTKALEAKLRHRWVKTRESQGSTVPYVEGWHAIAEANRIFGFDSWDRQTMSPQLVWSGMQRGDVVCFYSTKVRITVRAGGTTTVREGIGTGPLGYALSSLTRSVPRTLMRGVPKVPSARPKATWTPAPPKPTTSARPSPLTSASSRTCWSTRQPWA